MPTSAKTSPSEISAPLAEALSLVPLVQIPADESWTPAQKLAAAVELHRDLHGDGLAYAGDWGRTGERAPLMDAPTGKVVLGTSHATARATIKVTVDADRVHVKYDSEPGKPDEERKKRR